MSTLSPEKLRQRLEVCISWMQQLESASSEKMIGVAKDLYKRIRSVYREVIEFRKEFGEDGVKELMDISPGIYDLIVKMSEDFSRPLPEDNSFDYKQVISSKIIGEPITVVRQNIVFRGIYEQNVDGHVTYHENEFKLIKQSGATPDDIRMIHLIKKVFDGELLSAKGIFNPDLSYHNEDFRPDEIKKLSRPPMDVINLEFSDTR